MEIADKDLVSRLKTDDVVAFNEIYRRYHARIFQLAAKFLPYKEDSEEILQIVFIAVWNNRYKINEEQSFDSYLFSIARHSIYKVLRKAVYRQGYFEFIRHHSVEQTFITEEVVLYNELDTLLNKYIENLPPKRREIFRLFREEGLSYREISEKLSITASTVNSQLTKAIDYIRRNILLAYDESF